MRVSAEVEFDDTTLSVSREERVVCAMSAGRIVAAARTMGAVAGRMLAALAAGSDVPPMALMAEFNEAVVRAARCAAPTPGHTCDGVGCC